MNDATRHVESELNGGAAAMQGNPTSAEQDILELLNRGYVCPPEAGPAWREACEAGLDMGLIEDAMRMSPGERLREHQRSLNLVLGLLHARASHDSGS